MDSVGFKKCSPFSSHVVCSPHPDDSEVSCQDYKCEVGPAKSVSLELHRSLSMCMYGGLVAQEVIAKQYIPYLRD